MNREIKFRAWDKLTEKMLTDWSFTFKPNGEILHTGSLNGVSINGNVILMQFTGLTLRGKELYEGDIVCFNANYTDFNRCGYHNGVVVWSNDKARFELQVDGFEKNFDIDDETDEFIHDEIIGNIYENPELVNA